ncbi:apolipophorins [Pectinophora gossypiella]|nr:apolipophorins [Pectinophora gossypiella]
MGKSIKLSLSVLLVISVLWKPAAADKCSLSCKGSPTAPSFLSGHSYNYGVEGTVSIYLTGADKQETSVKLLGQVAVTAVGNCVNELKVQNLVISGPDGKKYSSPPGIDKPIQFTLSDGRVGAEICAEEGDTRRSLNIKRAIVSLLQTENKPSTQVDVFGACPTEASSSQEGSALLVHRSRDLSRCAYREQGKHDLLTGIYNPTAEIKNTQVLQSSLHVESKVNNGIPEKVSASEEYLYKPFSVGENGARAKVHTKLTLTGKGAGAPSGKCTEPRTVIFENPHGISSAGNAESALASVKDTAKTLGSEASSKSFAQLVRILRTVNKDELIRVYSQVKGNGLEKRVFLDGLLRAGTGYSVDASIQILKSRDLSTLEQQLVFLSLGNAKHVNNEALKAAAGLLDLPNLPKEIYLGVGALAGAYCRDHDCHKTKSEGVAALSQKLVAKLQNCKPKSKVEEDNVVAVLKGIRNVHHLEDSVIEKLIRCANDNSVKPRVRVAAIEAFSADPCSKVHKVAMDLMKNRQLDSEIRIKAYLSVIECPCAHSATEIKNLLETEPVHQVGRFITSSLRHIRASANPDRRLQKEHYGLIHTPNKFNIDDRKYSFYRELSYNVDALGIGGNVEETVIYSQDSFLPRSASLNLTAELFGHSLNILEVGGRQGNLDRVAEHFLGPKSFLRTEKPQDLYDNIVKKFQEAEKKVESGLSRGRRSVKTEVDNFDKHLKAESVPYNNELDLDVYLKLFGTDAVFLSLGDDKGFDFNTILDRVLKTLNGGVDKLKHFQQEVRAHLLFLDAELAYPTSTGFPLKLDLVGSATGRLDVATNIDLRQIYRSPKNAKVDIKLVPSTDVEISGLFIVDADAVSTGLKVITNLHSSTGGHVIAKVLEDGRGIDLQFGLPVDKQEILTASNDLVYVTTEKGRKEKQTPLKVDTDRKEYSGCFDQLSGILGLTLCGEVSVPFSVSGPDAQASLSKFIARYPLTGAAKLKLALEKNDLKGYHVKGVLRSDNPSKQGFEVLFEAEGSKNRRTSVSGELTNNNEEKSVKLQIESPIKTLYGEVAYINKPNERVAFVKAKLDAEEYYAKAGFIVQGNNKRSVYKPIVEYQVPGEKGKHSLKVDGQLVREVNGPATKYTLEGIKITLPSSNEVVDVNGHFNEEPKCLEVDLKAKKGEHNMLVSGSLKGSDVKLEFQNTLNPYVNFKFTGHFENTESLNHNDFELRYGHELRNPYNRINFNQLLKYHKKDLDFSVITKNKFEFHALPLKIEVDAEADPKKLDVELQGQYTDKKGEFNLEARRHIKKPGDYSVKVTAEVDKKGIEFLAKRDIVSADKSNLENYIVLKGVGKYELSGVVLHKNKQNDINIGAIGHLKISSGGKNEDIKFDVGVLENTQLYSSHAKIGYSKGEILDYLLKITRGANPSGQLKLVLKDTLAANGNFKVTDNDGKGHGMIIVDFKTQRKIKGDVKFQVKDPTYNAEVDVFLNFEKDNNDKVHFSTSNKRTEKLVDSKNKLEYGGKKTEVNIHRDGGLSSGKSHSNFEIVLPTERCLSLKLDQDVSIKDEVVNGHVEYVLSDATKRGGPASTITFKSKATDTDYDKNKLNIEGQLEVKLKDGKNLQNNFYLKNIPDNTGGAKVDFKTDLTGNLVPKPASLSLTGASAGYSKGVNDKYKLKGSYGNDCSFELEQATQIKYPEKGADAKYQDDSTLSIRLPFEKAHDIKWVSNILLLQSGQDVGEFTIIETLHLNGELYKLDSNGKTGPNAGFGKVKVVVPHEDPLVLEASYKADTDSDKKKASVEVKSQYGKGKTATVGLGAEVAPQEYKLLLQAHAPQAEKLKKLELQVISKVPAPDTYSSSVSVDADGRIYSYDVLAVSSKVHPVLDLKYKCPESPQTSRIYVKGDLADSHRKLDVKVENVRDVSLDFKSEAQISKDNVALKAVANSDKLGWKNYKVDISSKDAGSGKRLEFHATNDNKNILSGSTSFISKQEGPKTIIEGSGSVKVKDEQKSANFKYIRTVLTEGNEQGFETFLNLAIGERSYVAESRVTNLEYKNSYVYCEEKKQCANVEIQSKLNMPKPGVFQHLLNVGFDLRKLGFAPEFGLQVSNEVSEKRLPQYSLDLHVNKEDKKYYLHIYSQPEHGKFPAGITVTLPKRVLALESVVSYPADKALPFPIRGEVTLHLDKNKPQQKTAASFLVDVTGGQQQHSGIAEFKFSHPKLGKDASIKFHGNLQRPNENSLKVETSATVSHPTLGNDREGKVFFEVNPVHVKLLVSTPLVKVIDLEGDTIMKDNLQQGDLKFSLLEGKPVVVHAIAKDFQYYEFTTGYSDESERKLSIVGRIEPEKRIDVSADVILGKEKKNIVNGALYLQDNLVKSEYGISKDNFKYFVSALQKDLTNLEQRIKQLGEKANQEVKSILQRVEPTFKKLEEAYKDDIEKLYKEIETDQTLKEISEGLEAVAKFLAKIVDDIYHVTKPIVDKICQTVSETSKKVLEMYEKQIEPQLKQVYESIAALVKEYFEGLIDVVAHFAALITDFFEKHKPELEELTNTIAEIFKDLTRLLVAHLKEIRGKVAQILSDITQQIKELPIIGLIKEKWQELAVPEQALGLIQEGYNTVRTLLPTEESRNFVDALFNYVQKKLRQEKVDDAKELRVVYEKFAVALTSVVQYIRAQLNQFGVPTAININAIPWLTAPGQTTAPGLGGLASFSVLNQILKGDIPDPISFIRAYRPRSLNPLEEIPAKMRAVIVNGQHIFTFDGRHLTFPGNCRYVLAHDHVDRNFTLALQLQNGAPKALILEDKSGTTVELKDNGQVALNGVSGTFPVIEKDAFAFKEANGRIGLGTEYGLMAFCSGKLEVCYIEINGFYLGKLRGLLGDGNNEPYDDFRMVNGKITNSESEFGNSYRLASSCPQVKTPEHSHHQHHAALPPACEQVFGATSTLRPLALLLDVSPFRQACIHAVSGSPSNALQQACDLARGYTALAVTGLLPAVLPPVCLQCTDADAPKKIGDTYEIKLPNKQADIVVAVETTLPNEKNYKSLVVPLVSQVVDILKSKRISDIKVYLLGITNKMPYPIIYDTDLKLKSPKVKFFEASRYTSTPTVQTGIASVDKAQAIMAEVVDAIRTQLGLTNVVAGYSRIMDLPLRPGAVKHTISVIGEKCKGAFFLTDVLRALAYKVAFDEMAYTHTLVTVNPVTSIEGGKTVNQVVGYTKDTVILLGDKKPSKDSEALRATLIRDPDDACISFVENSDGIILQASNYLASNPGQQKQFLQTAATAITNQMLYEELVQECTCNYVDPFRARSLCVNKDRKEAARRRK